MPKRKLTPAEQKVLQFNAQEAGMSVPDYMKYKLSPEYKAKQSERNAKATENIKKATAAISEKRKVYQESEAGKKAQAEKEHRQNLQAQKNASMEQIQALNPHLTWDPVTRTFKEEQGQGFWDRLFKGESAYHKNFPIFTPGQEKFQDLMQQQVEGNLPGLLKGLSSYEKSPVATQLESMFGHMNNPVLQALMGGGPNEYKANVPFASELGQQQNTAPFEAALSQLITSGLQNAPAAFNYLGENAPQWYNQAQQSAPGQWLGNALSALSNRFMGQQNQQPL